MALKHTLFCALQKGLLHKYWFIKASNFSSDDHFFRTSLTHNDQRIHLFGRLYKAKVLRIMSSKHFVTMISPNNYWFSYVAFFVGHPVYIYIILCWVFIMAKGHYSGNTIHFMRWKIAALSSHRIGPSLMKI